MKIGDYVRTENGLIGKIIGFKGDMVETDNKRLITYKSNHSECKIKERPIDLIEVGDYVNGEKVRYLKGQIPESDVNSKSDVLYTEYYDEYGVWCGYEEDEIKSIVTCEMFESMKYKVGE